MAREKTRMNERIGMRIRAVRLAEGLTIQELGKRLGISYQQVQKYEKGSNRVSAETLWQIAGVFECPVSQFFGNECRQEDQTSIEQGLLLARRLNRIESPQVREAVNHLIKGLSS